VQATRVIRFLSVFEHPEVDTLFEGSSSPIQLQASSSNEALVQVAIVDNKLVATVVGASIQPDSVTITITATNEDGHSAEGSFKVAVRPAYGDLNADGRVRSSDATMILLHAVEDIVLNDIQMEVADLNLDGIIRSYDATLLLQYNVELIDMLPIELSVCQDRINRADHSRQFGRFDWSAGGSSAQRRICWYSRSQSNRDQEVYSLDLMGEFNPAEGSLDEIIIPGLTDGWISARRIDESGRFFVALAGPSPLDVYEPVQLKFTLGSQTQSISVTAEGFVNTSSYSLEPVRVKEIVEEFALDHNYPNPFNPTTTIRYRVPVESDIVIEIFNVVGQRVSRLVETRQTPGVYTIPVDMSSYSSGVYLVRMIATSENGRFTSNGKMSLIK
jgi:hypothetical protein